MAMLHATARPLQGIRVLDLARTGVRGADGVDLPPRRLIAPFARALALLGAFTPDDGWLGAGELVARTGVPPSTVTRIAASLVQLGYLDYARERRKYRLAPKVLALGYGTVAHAEVQRLACAPMRSFAEQHRLPVVNLSARDRLGLVVLESCGSAQAGGCTGLQAGARMDIGASPLGWVLLAALPPVERDYLLDGVERHMARDWGRVRRRANAAIAQVREQGFCLATDEARPDMAIVAAPLLLPAHPPLVLACAGSPAQLTRARAEREIGPRLRAMAASIGQAGVAA